MIEVKQNSNLVGQNENLSQRVIKGLAWIFSLHIATKVIWLARTVILARMLAPADFGLMGIALLAMFILEIFFQTGGFVDAAVQKKDNIDGHLDTLWTVQMILGVILFLILFFASPWIAEFFNNQKLVNILRVISISFLLSGFSNLWAVFFRRNLEFHKEFIYQTSGTLADIFVAVPFVFIFQNVWALVLGFLASSFVRFIFSYILVDFRPKIKIDWSKFKELFDFGKWVLGNRILFFFSSQGADLFLSKVLGAASLGLYQMSYRFSITLSSEFTTAVTKVTFPAYAKLQDAKETLSYGYLQVLRLSSLLTIPLGIGIFLLAPEFTKIFLGPNWLSMVQSLRILALAGMILAITSCGDALFLGKGRPRLVFIMTLIKIGVIAGSIYPLSRYFGVSGAAISMLLSAVAVFPIWILLSLRETINRARDYTRILLYPTAAAILMSFVVLGLKSLISPPSIFNFILVILAGVASFSLFILALEKIGRYKITEEFKFIVRNIK